MKMTFRWYGEDFDPIPLEHIRQIPGVQGVVGTLMDKLPGQSWSEAEVEQKIYRPARAAGLRLEVIESINVSDEIKLGRPGREEHIEAYARSIRAVSRFGVKVICYNFMPVFDWLRTDLSRRRADGSFVLAYDQGLLEQLREPQQIIRRMGRQNGGMAMPGWEPERLARVKELLAAYQPVTDDELRENLGYFLRRILPICQECGVKMALHPDDPPWRLFGLPRIAGNEEALQKICDLSDSPCHGLTLCTGSLGADPNNDVVHMIRRFGRQGRIHFAHVRNVRHTAQGGFEESAHLSEDGSLDLYQVMKAFHDVGYTGYVRPDHGRMIWGEQGRPGYGLYDRALGALYLQGLWEAIEKSSAS